MEVIDPFVLKPLSSQIVAWLDKAQREADADKFLNYALTIGKMKDADKERGLQAWQTEQSLAKTDRAYDVGRQDREEAVKKQ